MRPLRARQGWFSSEPESPKSDTVPGERPQSKSERSTHGKDTIGIPRTRPEALSRDIGSVLRRLRSRRRIRTSSRTDHYRCGQHLDHIAHPECAARPFDAVYASKTEWKKMLVDSTLTLALLTGMSVRTVSAKVVANLGWDKVKASHPVFAGDTLYAESTVLTKRESKSRP